jgi:antitoxin PrlF
LAEGHEPEFPVNAEGTVTMCGCAFSSADQASFLTSDWIAGEREADEELAAGLGTVHESADEMFAHLGTLGSADG